MKQLQTDQKVKFVLDIGEGKTEIRDGKITSVVNGDTAMLDISIGTPGEKEGKDKYREHHAQAQYSAERKPGTFFFDGDPEPQTAAAETPAPPPKTSSSKTSAATSA